MLSERMPTPKDAFKYQISNISHEPHDGFVKKGEFIAELRDEATGELLERRRVPNLITYDADIFGAMLLAGDSTGITMLAVGDGATGSVNNPDAPDKRFRRLNNEIARKAFSSIVYRDSEGGVSAVPTNIVDFTVSFAGSEAVGSLNEMSLMRTISGNPAVRNLNPDVYPARDLTRDLLLYDVCLNYATFGVINKIVGSVLTLTWRITC
jgi:hypothetical protein